MTRAEIIQRALQIVGDENLTAKARAWLDNCLYEVETLGYWSFLYNSTAVTATAQSQALSAMSITDYSKGIHIKSASYPYLLAQVAKTVFDEMSGSTATGAPTHFSLFNRTLYFYPTPSSTPLTVNYFTNISLPTDDADDLDTVVTIPTKWQRFLINGVAAEALTYLDDARQQYYRALWEKNISWMLRDNDDLYSSKESGLADRTGLYKTAGRFPLIGGQGGGQQGG